jgi:long-subunit acyl-CoA synthetase (AMP-forming)
MQIEPKFRTLIDLFNKSLAEIDSMDKKCLEIIRADREESLTFEQLKAGARDFAVWLIQSQDIRIGDKVAILGKNRADWDVALWGVILAGAIPVLIDPERPVEGVINHLTHTDSRLIVMADDYQNAESRRELKDFTAGHGMVFIEMTIYEKAGDSEAVWRGRPALASNTRPGWPRHSLRPAGGEEQGQDALATGTRARCPRHGNEGKPVLSAVEGMPSPHTKHRVMSLQ